MKYILSILLIAVLVTSCNKDNNIININVEGYWNVKDTTYANNSTRDLYHLFEGNNVFYRFSFLKTHDFSVLTSKPQSDSMITFYQVVGNQLQLPSPSPSTTTTYPGNNLLSKTDNQMFFTRLFIIKRDPVTGEVIQSRTDTIKYFRVTDPVKIAYFDNYLKQWHP